MKKICALVILSVIFVPTSYAAQQENTQYTQEFVKGFTIGTASSLVLEFLRHRILPNIDNWKLHDKTGICRDQLTGQTKVITAVVGAAALDAQTSQRDLKKISVQIAGIFTGICFGSFITLCRSSKKSS